MDGTLLNDKGDISPSNREAIRAVNNQGIEVVLSTGRYIKEITEFAEILSDSSYLVTANGSEIWKGFDQLIERHVIPVELVEWVLSLAVENDIWFWGMTTENVYHPKNFPDDVHKYDWLKIGMDTANDDVRKKIWKKLIATGKLEVTNSTLTNIEINAKGVNKAKGLGTVCELKNITMANVLSIGDSLNDIMMIKASGCGVAMENAQEAVKEAADWVTAINSEDGVARALRCINEKGE